MKFKLIISTAVRSVIANWNVLLKALLFPALLYLVVGYFQASEGNWLGIIVELIINYFIISLVAIPVHRVILLGPDSVSEWGFNIWSKKELMYAGVLIVMGIIPAVISFPLAFLVPKISTEINIMITSFCIILIFSFWIIGRLTLVLPAIAIGDKTSFKDAWDLTKKDHVSMLFVVLFFPALIIAPYYFLSLDSPLYDSIGFILYFFVEVFAIASLSIAYKMFVDEKSQSLPID
ncbi:MAG: hypothetical protein ACQ9MH_14080 [Nitrospinales bacterium]